VYHFTNEHNYHILNDIITAWNTQISTLANITQALRHVANMAQHINNMTRSTPITLWRDEWFMVQYFLPVLYEVLSLPRADLSQTHLAPEIVIREAVQLACLTLLSSINRRFKVSLNATMIYNAKVMELLTRYRVAWSPFLNLRLWVLVMGGLVAEDEVRAWHIGEISSTLGQLGIGNWKTAHSIVKEILWIDDLLDDEAQQFGHEVDQYVRQNPFQNM
jgi:hypothetical protein